MPDSTAATAATAATADRSIAAWEVTQRWVLAVADELEHVNTAIRRIWADEACTRWADAT